RKRAMLRPKAAQVREVRGEQCPKRFEQLVEAGRLVERNVIDLVQGGAVHGRRREQISLYDVFDIAEITHRFAVAIDVNRFIADHGGDPSWNDRRVGAVRVLAGTEYIEIAQADR